MCQQWVTKLIMPGINKEEKILDQSTIEITNNYWLIKNKFNLLKDDIPDTAVISGHFLVRSSLSWFFLCIFSFCCSSNIFPFRPCWTYSSFYFLFPLWEIFCCLFPFVQFLVGLFVFPLGCLLFWIFPLQDMSVFFIFKLYSSFVDYLNQIYAHQLLSFLSAFMFNWSTIFLYCCLLW